MLTNGFISLHRSLLKWEWYDDINTTRLFIHLLLTVNHYDETWRGIKIMRGQILTSTAKLSQETRLSVRQIRVAMTHLISTNEVTIKTTPQHTVITISQYDKYQRVTNKMTEGRQTNDKAVTNERQLSNKANKANKEINTNTDVFFDSVWKLYPRKLGKGKVSDSQKKTLHKIGVDEITRCVERYKAVNIETPEQYLQHGSTFFNSGYVDFLDVNHKAETTEHSKGVKGVKNL